MAEKLLVRMFDVGLGDCIYIRVPDKAGAVHILIDCGNKFSSSELLQNAIASLEKELPLKNSKRVLDLLVVTHPHEDHHKGFEPGFFKNIQINNLWLSPAFCELDEKCQKLKGGSQHLHALQLVAQNGLRSLAEALPMGETREYLNDMLLSLSKSEAFDELNRKLPERNKIKPKYVTADFNYDPDFTRGDVSKLFKDPETSLTILGPMSDIDKYYLGGSGQPLHLAPGGETEAKPSSSRPNGGPSTLPGNISSQDFELLRRGVQGNPLAVAEIVGHAVNNLSVVLLLTWKGKRLLFPGDAEWDGSKVELKPGGNNGSWNVMWATQQVHLSKPLDFLKVGHHGSENATPWAKKDNNGKHHPISEILNKLLPVPKGGKKPKARAVVSTQRTSRWQSIPDPDLIGELGGRVLNAKKNYIGDKKIAPGISQPQRTDQERNLNPKNKWIDVTFSPK